MRRTEVPIGGSDDNEESETNPGTLIFDTHVNDGIFHILRM